MAEVEQTVVDLECRYIPCTSTGAVALFTTRPTFFAPTQVLVGVRRIAGFTSVPTISIGTNAPNYNNIIPATAATGLNAVGKFAPVNVGASSVIPPGTPIFANVTVAANATTYQVDLHLLGIYT